MPSRPLTGTPLVVAALVTLTALALYVATLAPTVTLVDSGELIVAAHGLGVAHPPGFPLYTLIAHAATWLPAGNVAERVHLVSALFGALAAGALSLLVFDLVSTRTSHPSAARRRRPRRASPPPAEGTAATVGAAVGGLLLVTSRTIWSYATVAEVYTLSVFLLVSALALVVRWRRRLLDAGTETTPDHRLLYAAAGGVGLAAGVHHVSAGLALPALLWLVWSVRDRARIGRRVLLLAAACLTAPLTVYLYLPLAAARSPLVNWGDPSTIDRFVTHVTGWQYHVFVSLSFETMIGQLRDTLWPFLTREFGPPWLPVGLGLAAVGTLRLRAHDRALATALVLLAAVDVGYALNYDIDEDQDAYYLPLFVALAAAAGAGAASIVSAYQARADFARRVAIAMVFAAPAVALVANLPYTNRSRYFIAHDYVTNILSTVRPGGMLLTLDWQVYSPWLYLRHIEGTRPDVVAIDVNLLRRTWYFDYLERQYPALFEAARPVATVYLDELRNWDRDPDRYNRDPVLNRRINDRYYQLIATLVDTHAARAPVYLTQELLVQDRALAGALADHRQVPQGLVFELTRAPGFVAPAEPRLELRGLFDGTIRFDAGDVVRQKVVPVYVTMLVNRGRYFAAFGFHERAVALYREALALDPDDIAARQSLAALPPAAAGRD